jgi:hypothetical protein
MRLPPGDPAAIKRTITGHSRRIQNWPPRVRKYLEPN